MAITLGRPVGINDVDVDVEYPLDIDDDCLTEHGINGTPRTSVDVPATTVSSAIHTIRIRQIWGRMQALLYPQIGVGATPMMSVMLEESFRSELKKWLEEAPNQLNTNERHNNTFGSEEWFELMYQHSILILHRHKLVAIRSSAAEPYRECFDVLSSSTQAMMVDSLTTMGPPSPSMPLLLTSPQGQLPDFLSSIAEIGMCSSVEALLSGMIE
ncbi:hypothetical protein N7470_004285 [Penicillium chermesinum]|nr:hypothetical protein N7470_004285 [Penicillium chermesinum]